MKIIEIIESAVAVWGRKGSRNVRKYRCSSGSRKGQLVAKPTTCTKPKNMAQSRAAKITRRTRASIQSIKSKKTRSNNPASKRLRNLNKGRSIKNRRGRKI